MASTVQTSGGSGVDLSELTNAEKELIAWFTPKVLAGYETFTLDFSRISSITIRSSGWMSVTAWNASDNVIISNELIQPEKTLQVPSSVRKMNFVTDYSSSGSNVQIVSFTTTDGKVHTASNLNY